MRVLPDCIPDYDHFVAEMVVLMQVLMEAMIDMGYDAASL